MLLIVPKIILKWKCVLVKKRSVFYFWIYLLYIILLYIIDIKQCAIGIRAYMNLKPETIDLILQNLQTDQLLFYRIHEFYQSSGRNSEPIFKFIKQIWNNFKYQFRSESYKTN